jgi:hypothetical protein
LRISGFEDFGILFGFGDLEIWGLWDLLRDLAWLSLRGASK